MTAAIDDMLGKFDRTSAAYKEGARIGKERMKRNCAAVVEKMLWEREARTDDVGRTEYDILTVALAAMNEIDPNADIDLK